MIQFCDLQNLKEDSSVFSEYFCLKMRYKPQDSCEDDLTQHLLQPS